MKKLLLVSLCFLMFCITQVFAQNRTVTGTVTAKDDGLPIPGATVKVKGTSVGTQTNATGKYSLSVPANAVLVISSIGYSNAEVPVGTKSVIDVRLSINDSQLNEVVVTALGIQRQAISLGYSTAKVSAKELTQAKPLSVINGLTGKVSGLEINTVNNGLFAPTRVTLRGNRSLTGNNQPLYVVDGAIFYSDISTLNPEDIAETSVLKGSSASAVYGSDASNGVILITTKHGTKTTPSVTVSSSVSLEHVSYMPSYQTRFGSNGGEKEITDFNDLSTYIPYENQSYGPEYNGKLVPLGRPLPDGSVLMVPYSAVPNQKEGFFRTAVTTQQNFSYSSGDATGSFFMSGQDAQSQAVTPGDEGRRDVLRISGDKKYGIFTANYSFAYTYLTKNTTNTGSVYDDLIELPTLAPLNTLYKDPHGKYGNPNDYFNDYYLNPYEIIQDQRNLDVENHIQANVQLQLKPAKWVNLSYRAAIDNNSARTEYTDAGITYDNASFNNLNIYYSNPTGTGLDTAQDAGTKAVAASGNPKPVYGVANITNLLFSSDFIASFNTKLSKDFGFNATGGVSYLDNKITYAGINPGALNFLPYNPQNFSNVPNVTSGYAEARKLGYFGEAQVSFETIAFLHGSYRTDLDTRLSKANRYIPYYDVDASLVISEWFKDAFQNDIFNFAKVRFAHSLTGNVSALARGSQYIAFGAYQTLPTVGSAYGFPYSSTGLSGYSLGGITADPNIKPEKVTENELGIDLGFLKDRLTLTASAYKSNTKDGIVYASVSKASGYSTALINAANTQNQGIELDLHGTIVKNQNVSWILGVNYTHQESKVNSIVSGVKSLALTSNINAFGQPGGTANTYAVVGLPYPEIQGYDWQRDPSNGKIIVDPNTGMPTRSTTLSVLGNANPTDIIGITSALTYKGFNLNLTIDYRGGYKIFNQIANAQDHSGVGVGTTYTGRQRFVFPNSEYLDPSSGKYVANNNVETVSDNFDFWPTAWIGVDANYITSAAAWKLREAVIGYTFPKAWLADAKFIKGVNISISGRNLLMFRPSTNQWTDPEFSDDTSNAIGRTTVNETPPTRIFTGTLAVTF